jgi:hypothetical protein
MRYHQFNKKEDLMTEVCFSRSEMLENGKIRLYGTWEWTSGDQLKGKSILEEI